jgi:hypothetical protein
MGSVSSTPADLSDVVQTLSAASPLLSSVLATPNVQSALASASPEDLVRLSDDAMQLQQVGMLFGNDASTQSNPFGTQETGGNGVLQALEASLTSQAAAAIPSSTTSTTTPSLSSAESTSQQQLMAELFDPTSTTGSLLNVLG